MPVTSFGKTDAITAIFWAGRNRKWVRWDQHSLVRTITWPGRRFQCLREAWEMEISVLNTSTGKKVENDIVSVKQ